MKAFLEVDIARRQQQLDLSEKRLWQNSAAWPSFRFLAVFCLVLIGSAPATAAQLIMFESGACSWCKKWDAEIAPIYTKTVEARIAPLRRVDLFDERPADLQGLKAVIYTPTFVLMDRSREIGRIVGYPGEDFFWALLEELMGKLAQDQERRHQSARDSGSASALCGDPGNSGARQNAKASC